MIPEFEKIRARVMYNGSVHWEPGGVFSTTCDIDIAFFPFDRQACPIHIGAWSYTSARMNLTNVTSSMEMQQFTVNGEWEVTSTNAEWEEIILQCCRDISYSKVVFTVYMKRRSAFYIVNIILPCCLLSVLILVVFCVPPDAGEKLSAGISVLLAFTVFLLMLADAVPRTSLDTPILVMYLSVTMISGTVSVCLTVIVLNIHHRGSHRPVPRCIHAIFFQCLGRCLGITHTNAKLRRLGSTKRQRNSDYMLNDPEQTGSIEIQSIIPGDSNNHVHNTFTLKERMPIGYGRRERHQSVTERCTREAMLEQQMEENSKDWRLLARIMDRVFFILVTMTMILSAVLILSSPYYTEPGQKKTK